MKIFLDTNFIIDYLIREEYKASCEQLLSIGIRNKFEFCISYLTVANFAYILRKTDVQVLHNYIKRICNLFYIVPSSGNQILNSLKLKANDFEDGLQYQAAIDYGCDCIISRNAKDFKFAKIPVLTAQEFINSDKFLPH